MRRIGSLLLAGLLLATTAAARDGMVATEHQLAANAGADVLRAGGSVVDAAIAAAAAVCVVHASSCGIGGGGFALVHDANAHDAALDYRERAPAEARPERYLVDGKPDPARTRTGGLAVGVPGEVAGWVALHQRFGRLPLPRVLAPAIALARDGFPLEVTPHLRREIERTAPLLRADPGLRVLFLTADGGVPGPDFRVVLADLARTLEAIATDGSRAFYAGPTAVAIASAAQARGGVLSAGDLAAYRPIWRRPLTGTLRGRRIITFPPPGSGGVVLEIVGILARDDLMALGAGSAATLHLVAGAMAQGFADRARWYGDPDFTPVPTDRLLASRRLAALRARLRSDQVIEPTVDVTQDAGTANVSVVDTDGNAAAITTTINTGFGAGILVPGTGIILNNEMDDFAVAPGQANVYGLVGGAANAIAPGKRPQSSMSPTIVLRNGKPELVVGGSGGPTIISGVLQVLLGVVAQGATVPAAVTAPRIHDQASPPVLAVEASVAPEARALLGRIGHRVVEMPAIGAVSAVGLTADGTPSGSGDTRKDGGVARVP
jgi:gamma-glutamyltranspeptidase/glutathione hydrolase